MERITAREAGRITAQYAAIALLLLSSAAPAGAAGPTLDDILERAARQAEQFTQSLPDVKCTERVTQAKLNPKGGVDHKQESTFDFLLMPLTRNDEIVVQESRLLVTEARRKENLSLLVTNGFSTILLVFHPYYRGSFTFELIGEETLEGQPAVRIHFRHIRGTRSPTGLLLRGREYPLELEGVAWVNGESGAILKISTTLAAAMDDIGLRSFHSEVRYMPISFSAAAASYWLPVRAAIEVETPRQHWRNVHAFTDYKLFSVSSNSSIQAKP